MKNIIRKTITALLGVAFIFTAAVLPDIDAKADGETVLITEYADLWNGNITVKTGETVKWYVNIPEGTELKGCGATIKIPELGLGTDSNDKEDEHITLVQGENFIYEFTPEKEGDILFNCWMGSGCHHNYIHVTSNGTYSAQKPADATNVSAKRSGSEVEVSFTAPETPNGAEITGYKVIAADENGKRKKAVVKESPAVFEELDEAQGAIKILGGGEILIREMKLPTLDDSRAVIYVDKKKSTPEKYPRRESLIRKIKLGMGN